MAKRNQAKYSKKRRALTRDAAKDCYRAEIRLAGVAIYEAKLKDLSLMGASILVKEDSFLLNKMKVGKALTVKYYLDDRSKPTNEFKAQIEHITKVNEGRFKGHYLAGLSILK